jgi:hypothetical protein
MSKSFEVPAGADATEADDDSPPADAATAASLAGYIAEMAAEMAIMAERADLPMLSYFLRLARVEAESKARELGSPAPSVGGAGRA